MKVIEVEYTNKDDNFWLLIIPGRQNLGWIKSLGWIKKLRSGKYQNSVKPGRFFDTKEGAQSDLERYWGIREVGE